MDHAFVSPWLSGGFGYGLYEGSSRFGSGVVNPQIHRNVATAQFGGGLDLRTPLRLLIPIGIRGEVRDYYSLEAPNFGIPVRRSGQHNIVVAGGLVVRF